MAKPVDTVSKSSGEGVVTTDATKPGSSRIKAVVTAVAVLIASVLVAIVVQDPGQLRQYLPSDTPIQDVRTSTSQIATFVAQLQKAVATEPTSATPGQAGESRLEPAQVVVPEPKSQPGESKPAEAAQPQQQKPPSILDWMTQGGANFPHVQLVEYADEYRGIHLTADLGEDEIVMEVPEQFIITFATALASDIGQRIVKALPEYNDLDMSHYLIATFLAVEYDKGPDSWWWPYLETLPTQFKNMPPNFTPEEKAMMKESRLESLLDEDFEDDYNEICGAVPDFCQNHTLERYIWARFVMRTRAFSLDKDGIDQTAMQPFADMINHDFEQAASWRYDQERRTGQIYTRRPVKAGETLTISYGAKPNRQLLSTYGFAVKGNPNYDTPVYLQLPDGEIASGMLARRVAKHGNPNTEFYRILHKITLSTSDDDFKSVMKLCRISVATSDELDQYSDFREPVNLRNEAAALRYLQESLDDSLYKYATTIEEDDELLRNSSLTDNQRNIIITRQSDKLGLLKMNELIDDLLDIVPESVDLATFNRRRYHKKFADHKKYARSLGELRRAKRPVV